MNATYWELNFHLSSLTYRFRVEILHLLCRALPNIGPQLPFEQSFRVMFAFLVTKLPFFISLTFLSWYLITLCLYAAFLGYTLSRNSRNSSTKSKVVNTWLYVLFHNLRQDSYCWNTKFIWYECFHPICEWEWGFSSGGFLRGSVFP